MFKAICICEYVPFPGAKGLLIVSEDFQEGSFKGKQLCQVTDDYIHGGRAHMK